MDVVTLFELINKYGLGLVSYGVLIFGGYKFFKMMETFMTNHWVHFEESMNTKLDRIISLIETQQTPK